MLLISSHAVSETTTGEQCERRNKFHDFEKQNKRIRNRFRTINL